MFLKTLFLRHKKFNGMKLRILLKTRWILWLTLIIFSFENSLFGSSPDTPLKKLTTVVENADEGFLQINFTFPETVEAGQLFIFESVISKKSDYPISGKFVFIWPEGFSPVLPDQQIGKYKVEKNKMFVEWDSKAFTNDIKISYPVQVNNVLSGVYPILSVLNFAGGNQIEKNTKIRVSPGAFGNLPDHTIVATTGTYSVILDYPREVEFGNPFNLAIHINKGNVSGKARLHVTLLPYSEVKVLNHEGFEYKKQTGKLDLNWQKLPDNSTIEINCQVVSNNSIKAVYPISAEFYIEEKLRAVFSNSIYLSSKPVVLPKKSVETDEKKKQEMRADSIKLYAEMDELLNQWKNATKVVTIETGTANLLPSTGKTDVSKKTESEPVKKTEPVITKKPELETADKPAQEKTRTDVKIQESVRIESVRKEQNQPDVAPQKETKAEGVKTFRVQIAASPTDLPDMKQFVQSLGFFDTLTEDYDGTWYRYFIGEFKQVAEAKDFQKLLQEKGFNDGFVVIFIDGKRVASN